MSRSTSHDKRSCGWSLDRLWMHSIWKRFAAECTGGRDYTLDSAILFVALAAGIALSGMNKTSRYGSVFCSRQVSSFNYRTVVLLASTDCVTFVQEYAQLFEKPTSSRSIPLWLVKRWRSPWSSCCLHHRFLSCACFPTTTNPKKKSLCNTRCRTPFK